MMSTFPGIIENSFLNLTTCIRVLIYYTTSPRRIGRFLYTNFDVSGLQQITIIFYKEFFKAYTSILAGKLNTNIKPKQHL